MNSLSDTFRIGIYVTTLYPSGASQRRMQSQIFRALANAKIPDSQFLVLTHDADLIRLSYPFSHVPLGSKGLPCILQRIRAFVQAISYHLPRRDLAFRPYSWFQALRLAVQEPAYYATLRSLNIRLLYNMNQHHLPSPLPFIQTVWDVSHRVHPYFPEFSYSRFGFEQLDRDFSRFLPKASYVITGTHAGREQVCSFYGLNPERVRVIPLPAPHLVSEDPPSVPVQLPNRPYIFYPARFWPHKNHITLLHSLSYLHSSFGLPIELVLTGQDGGGLSYILQTAERLSVRQFVHVLGDLPDEALPGLYANAFALVFPSPVGPDNLPPLEAMVLNCPVIAARTEGSDEQLQDAALFFDPYNHINLAEKILQLYNDPSLRENLIRRGQLLTQARSSASYANHLVAIFDEFRLISRCWYKADSRVC